MTFLLPPSIKGLRILNLSVLINFYFTFAVHLEPFQIISGDTANEKSSRLTETQMSLNEATEQFQSFRAATSLKENTSRMQKVKEMLDSVTVS